LKDTKQITEENLNQKKQITKRKKKEKINKEQNKQRTK